MNVLLCRNNLIFAIFLQRFVVDYVHEITRHKVHIIWQLIFAFIHLFDGKVYWSYNEVRHEKAKELVLSHFKGVQVLFRFYYLFYMRHLFKHAFNLFRKFGSKETSLKFFSDHGYNCLALIEGVLELRIVEYVQVFEELHAHSSALLDMELFHIVLCSVYCFWFKDLAFHDRLYANLKLYLLSFSLLLNCKSFFFLI